MFYGLIEFGRFVFGREENGGDVLGREVVEAKLGWMAGLSCGLGQH